MDTAIEVNPVLDATREARAAAQAELDALLAGVAEAKRDLNDDEAAKFEKLADKIDKLDKRAEKLEKLDRRAAKAVRASAGESTIEVGNTGVRVHSQMTYRQFGEHSFLRDLAAVMVPEAGFERGPAEARMSQHHK